MKIFQHKKSSPELVTSGRFELEQDGHVAMLSYNLTGNILELIETEVPEALRGSGIAAQLAESAFQYARERHLKVDITCPYVAGYVQNHPEHSDLILH